MAVWLWKHQWTSDVELTIWHTQERTEPEPICCPFCLKLATMPGDSPSFIVIMNWTLIPKPAQSVLYKNLSIARWSKSCAWMWWWQHKWEYSTPLSWIHKNGENGKFCVYMTTIFKMYKIKLKSKIKFKNHIGITQYKSS